MSNVFFKNLGLKTRHIAGMNINAHTRQRNSESMINKANDWMSGKEEKNKTANPSITAKALIQIPRPMVFNVMITLVA
jgi:hypothetical protein